MWAIVSPYEDLGGGHDGLSCIYRNLSVETAQLTSGLEDLSISRRFNVRATVRVSCGLQGMEGGRGMREVRYCQLAANALASRNSANTNIHATNVKISRPIPRFQRRRYGCHPPPTQTCRCQQSALAPS